MKRAIVVLAIFSSGCALKVAGAVGLLGVGVRVIGSLPDVPIPPTPEPTLTVTPTPVSDFNPVVAFTSKSVPMVEVAPIPSGIDTVMLFNQENAISGPWLAFSESDIEGLPENCAKALLSLHFHPLEILRKGNPVFERMWDQCPTLRNR